MQFIKLTLNETDANDVERCRCNDGNSNTQRTSFIFGLPVFRYSLYWLRVWRHFCLSFSTVTKPIKFTERIQWQKCSTSFSHLLFFYFCFFVNTLLKSQNKYSLFCPKSCKALLLFPCLAYIVAMFRSNEPISKANFKSLFIFDSLEIDVAEKVTVGYITFTWTKFVWWRTLFHAKKKERKQ